jgi:predicted DNA binding CopG/RHH family protein
MATDRQQINITLSDRALEDYKKLADWQGIAIASLLRQILETNWSNPGTQALIKRAKSESEPTD